MASSTNASVYGQPVTFTAAVSPLAATGTVTLQDGSTALATALLSGGSATLTYAALHVTGSPHTVTVVYGGDTTYIGSTSAVVSQTVSQDSTTTTVSLASSSSAYGQPVTVTATVSPGSPGTLTPSGGIVTFYDGGISLSTASLVSGSATYTTTGLNAATHTITAAYGGSSDFTGSPVSNSTTLTVNQATTTTLTVSNSYQVVGRSVRFTASVTIVSPGSGSLTGVVTFLDGGTTIGSGTLNAGMTTLTTSTLTAGAHTITAIYGGDSNCSSSTSSAVSLTVDPAILTWTGTTSNNWSVASNWVGVHSEQAAPFNNDSLVFLANACNLANNNDLTGLTINSITISGSGYALSGNAIGLSSGISDSAGTNTISIPLTLTAAESISVSAGSNLTVSGTVAEGSQLLTIASAGNTTLSGVVSGSSGLTTTGSGTVTLTGVNTYTGTTTISAGTMLVSGNGSTTGTACQVGTVTDNGALIFNYIGNGTVSGTISGSGTLTQAGTGTLVLTGNNTYSGATTIAAGTVQAGAAGVLSPNSAVIVNQGAVLALNGFNNSIGSLAGDGIVALGGGTLTTGDDNTSTTFSGLIGGSVGTGNSTSPNFPTGFTSSRLGSGAGQIEINKNGCYTPVLNGSSLRMTTAATFEGTSGWYTTKQDITQFTTTFTFLFSGCTNPPADGLAFVIQNSSAGINALGGNGGGLGYLTQNGITGNVTNSIAIMFDAYLGTNGVTGWATARSTIPSPWNWNTTALGGGVQFKTGSCGSVVDDPMRVTVTYDGSVLSWTITNTVTHASFSQSETNAQLGNSIQAIVGSNTAYVGFTAGTGGCDMNVDVQNWTYGSLVAAGPGAVAKVGSGTHTLAGPSVYTGNTTVTGGTLLATNTAGSATGSGTVVVTGNTSVLSGTGTVGSIIAQSGGTVSPGGPASAC